MHVYVKIIRVISRRHEPVGVANQFISKPAGIVPKRINNLPINGSSPFPETRIPIVFTLRQGPKCLRDTKRVRFPFPFSRTARDDNTSTILVLLRGLSISCRVRSRLVRNCSWIRSFRSFTIICAGVRTERKILNRPPVENIPAGNRDRLGDASSCGQTCRFGPTDSCGRRQRRRSVIGRGAS